MAEGITEIWNITWVCLTLANPECAAIHNKPDGMLAWNRPNEYYSEQQCESFAEHIAERQWNEKRIKLEYYCDKVRTYEPFVPTRRYRKTCEREPCG